MQSLSSELAKSAEGGDANEYEREGEKEGSPCICVCVCVYISEYMQKQIFRQSNTLIIYQKKLDCVGLS